MDTVAQQASAAAQVELFINYECAVHDIRAETVVQKLWAVGAKHRQARMPDPFHNNSLLKWIIANNRALDDPSMLKVPVINSTLKEIRRNLQLHKRPDFVLWVGLRFAIAYLCRISEWAVNDKHTVRWEHLVFYTHKHSAEGRQKITLTSAKQLNEMAEHTTSCTMKKVHYPSLIDQIGPKPRYMTPSLEVQIFQKILHKPSKQNGILPIPGETPENQSSSIY